MQPSILLAKKFIPEAVVSVRTALSQRGDLDVWQLVDGGRFPQGGGGSLRQGWLELPGHGGGGRAVLQRSCKQTDLELT